MKKFWTAGAVGWIRTGKLHVSLSVSGPITTRSMNGFVAPAVPARASTPSIRAAMTPNRRFIWKLPSAVFSDGEIFGSGPFVGTATNLDTTKTVKINLSGSFSVVEHSDGTTTITSNGFVLSSLFGTIFSGHGVLELDASGNVTSRTFNGTERDLCAELADP